MKFLRLSLVVLAVFAITRYALAQKQHIPASSIPAADLIQPADFAAALQTDKPKPLILQVGSRVMFDLKTRIAALPKDSAIVLYCGCCPWERCPNIAAAYNLLHAEGFTNIKVLYIADNFGNDWVNKGYPTEKGR
jgi:rhodanese-related sulfurtransferase